MKLRYKLTFECTDYGDRRFEAENEAQDQGALSQSLACDISRMLAATLNSPPSAMQVAGYIEGPGNGIISGLAYAVTEAWTAENSIGECIEIVVDLAKLTEGAEDKDVETSRRVLSRLGLTLK